jgi:pyruvate kinase
MHKESLEDVLYSLEQVLTAIEETEKLQSHLLEHIHPNYTNAARNLIHYLAFRSFDLRQEQELLSAIGISSLGNIESHVKPSVENVIYLLKSLLGEEPMHLERISETAKACLHSMHLQENNVKRLLSNNSTSKRTRIMVTMPGDAFEQKDFVQNLVSAGMDIARINTGHDTEKEWIQIVEAIKLCNQSQDAHCGIYMDLAGPKIRTTLLSEKPKKQITLHVGDELEVHASKIRFQKIKHDEAGTLIQRAKISITLPSIVQDVKVGEQIWFDDGKIGGVIIACEADYFVVRITRCALDGSKLANEKGINLPDSKLNLPSLTDDDLRALPFICSHADTVGYSFVRKAEDVAALQHELQVIGKQDIGIILKIENNEAFKNLPYLLLQAMQSPNIGVMIARGDLAVELGAERIAEVQEEILWLCEAALIPNIWATQVLEALAKKGIATRAEITDASMASRSECVMLNKGPHILETVGILRNIISRMHSHQNKKRGNLRALSIAKEFKETKRVR